MSEHILLLPIVLIFVAGAVAYVLLYRWKARMLRGPLVLVVDKSGSMHGALEQWASTFVRVLLDQAAADKRDAHLLYFDHEVGEHQFFPKGQGEVLPRPPCIGGTDFRKALTQALLLCDDGRHRPNIIMVTDGMDFTNSEFLSEFVTARNKVKARIDVVFLDYGSAGDKWVHKTFAFAHQLYRIDANKAPEGSPILVGAMVGEQV